MVADIEKQTKTLFWSGIVLGSLSIGILGFAIMRNWNRWKVWREQRALQQSIRASNNRASNNNDEDQIPEEQEEEAGAVPDGQLCVICLMRRRRSAFIPCGHLVCCQHCSVSIETEISPKCPVCRQDIRTSVRIYDS